MGLWFGLLRGVGGATLRFALLLLLLFGVHLLLTQALPHVERTLALAERLAPLRAELLQTREELAVYQSRAARLELELEREKQAALQQLEGAKQQWQLRVEELQTERTRLVEQLARLDDDVQRHCRTLNPLKLWLCSEIRERAELTRSAVQPLLRQVSAQLDAAQRELQSLERRWDELLAAPAPRVVSRTRPDSTLTLELQAQRERQAQTEQRLTRLEAELQRARVARRSWPSWVLEQWRAVRLRLLGLVLLLCALPYVQRTLWYFLLMPLVSRARPLRLRPLEPSSSLTTSQPRRTLTLELSEGETLRVRANYARPVEGPAHSQLLYSWRAPAVSYAAGLSLLTRLGNGGPARASLCSPHASTYLMRVDLQRHPGLVIHPKSLVGVIGELELRTVWRVTSWHAWATGQLRYILLRGSGGLIVEGHGDLVAASSSEKRVKIEQELVVAFDAQLELSTARTETFLPYLFGKTRLVDDVFRGPGTYFWQHARQPSATNPVERGFDLVFGALGKLLGF